MMWNSLSSGLHCMVYVVTELSFFSFLQVKMSSLPEMYRACRYVRENILDAFDISISFSVNLAVKFLVTKIYYNNRGKIYVYENQPSLT
jgi:hypothetical protein